MAFISAATIQQMFHLCQSDCIYDEALRKYFPKKDIRDEFSQEIWLHIFEHPDKMLEVYNKRYFRYYFLNIVRNQVMSSSSSWHKKFRKPNFELVEKLPEQTEEMECFIDEELERDIKIRKTKIKLINKAIKHYMDLDPAFKPNADFFKEHYINGLSIRAIGKKYFDTPHSVVHEYIQEARIKIKFYITKYHSNLNLKNN